MRVALEVHADQGFVHRFEDALEAGFLGGIAEGLAQFFGGGSLFDFSGEIDDRDGRGRDAQRIAVELALQVRE